MVYLIIFAVCSAFVAFFSLLELRYFWLFPLFFLVFFVSQGVGDMRLKIKEADLAEKYGLYGLGLLIFFGLFGMLEFVGFSYQSAFFVLLMLCWGLWYASYFLDYADGKKLFKHGFLFTLFLLLGNSLWSGGVSAFWGMFGLVLLFAVLGFWGLWYGVWAFRAVEKEQQHYFFFALLLGLWDAVFMSIAMPLYALNIDLLLYAGFLGALSYGLSLTLPAEVPLRREVSLRRILAGERILPTKADQKKQSVFFSFARFLQEIPAEIKHLLEYLNVLLLIGILISYLLPFFQGMVVPQLWYWTGIAIFLFNAFLLKKHQMFTVVSRFAVVVIINFSLYISLLAFGEGLVAMLPWLIAWNILCGILIFYTRFPSIKAHIKKMDLIFWLLASLVAMLLNIVLLMRLSLSGQLIFSLIFFYLGIQGTIAYYAVQLIRNYELPEKKDWSNNPLDAFLDQEIKLP